MKKYLILADGNSTHTLKWVKELSKYFIVYVISFNGFSDDVLSYLPMKNCFNIKTEISVSGGNVGALRNIKKVSKLLAIISPHYINAHYITSYGTVGLLAAKLIGYKGEIILSAWGSDILVTPKKNYLYKLLTNILLKKANLVTSDSSYMTQVIKDICKSANVMTFPFGIEKMPFISFEDKNYNWYFSNRALEPNYNVDKIIEFFSSVYKNNAEARLVIAHDGTERPRLEAMVDNLGLQNCVSFVGFLSETEQGAFYRKCGYYLSVPTSDSTSVSLLEAMAYGCIPMVSDLPANREWIEDGDNGLIGLKECCLNKENVFKLNREIIRNKAIWKENIKSFIAGI